MPNASSTEMRIVICYDSKDAKYYEEFWSHLSQIRNTYPAIIWRTTADLPTSQSKNLFIGASLIIFLVSIRYQESERGEQEKKQAIELYNAKKTPILPIHLSKVDWQGSLFANHRILPSKKKAITDYRNRDGAYVDIAQNIRKLIEHIFTEQPRPSAQDTRIYDIPYPYNPFFTGRRRVRAMIPSYFINPEENSITPFLSLSGSSGIGKTQTAVQYCYDASENYQTILWLNASSRTILSASLRASSLAYQLSLSAEEREDDQSLFIATRQWLRDHQSWLLVLDNLNNMDISKLIIPPQSTGHVLFTRRELAPGEGTTDISLPVMDDETSLLFLLRRSGLIPRQATLSQAAQESAAQLKPIAQATRGIPLYLNQAAAYLATTNCSPAQYLALHQEPQESSSDKDHPQRRDTPPPTPLASQPIAHFIHNRRTHKELLSLLALLYPDAIAIKLFTGGAEALSGPLRKLLGDNQKLYQVFNELREYGLLERGVDNDLFFMHSSDQNYLLEQLDPQQRREWAQKAVLLVNRAFPEIRSDTKWECLLLLPQAEHCASLISDYDLALREGALLLERLGFYHYRHAAYAASEAFLKQSLQIYEKLLALDSEEAAQTLNSLALLYQQQACYSKAEELYEQALELRERLLGSDHRKTAQSLHNLAALYVELERYQLAEKLYLRVLSLEERTKGDDHLDLAPTLNNLGQLYYYMERYAEAQAAFQRSVALYKRHNSNHPDLMHSLNGLGILAEERGDYQQAERLYQEALDLCKRAYGEQHPEMALSINALGDIAEARGNYEQAEQHYQQALHISEKALGPDHPDVALFLNNLGIVASKQGSYQEAEDYHQKALGIYRRKYEDQHSLVAQTYTHLGRLAREAGDDQRAETFLRSALAVYEHTPDIPPTQPASILLIIADLLSDRMRYTEAISLIERALALFKQSYDSQDAKVIAAQEKYTKLLKLSRQAKKPGTSPESP